MSFPIEPSDRAWLESSGLIEPGVDLGAVRLSFSGPPAWWVRMQGRSAITIGTRIWFSKPEKLRDRALLAHELVHVGQYRDRGVPRFLVSYLRDMAKARFKYSSALPLEAPAYARQRAARALLAPATPPAEPEG